MSRSTRLPYALLLLLSGIVIGMLAERNLGAFRRTPSVVPVATAPPDEQSPWPEGTGSPEIEAIRSLKLPCGHYASGSGTVDSLGRRRTWARCIHGHRFVMTRRGRYTPDND